MSNKFPIFSPSQEVWDLMMVPFSERGQWQMANQVAHKMLPVQVHKDGYLLTRSDYAEKDKIMLVRHDGSMDYNFTEAPSEGS